jgi:phosphoribosyl-AMP cyclohydrolase
MSSVSSSASNAKWLKKVKWDENGLVPVIAQEAGSKDVLMFAWMNRDALARTVELGQAVYWSRSRKKLWHKGEESGNFQKVLEIRLDCDEDVILLKIEQSGGIACHTGRHSCFFQQFEGDSKDGEWQVTEPVLQDPDTIYPAKAMAKAKVEAKTKTATATATVKVKPKAGEP